MGKSAANAAAIMIVAAPGRMKHLALTTRSSFRRSGNDARGIAMKMSANP
jgi:hypothetical protein